MCNMETLVTTAVWIIKLVKYQKLIVNLDIMERALDFTYSTDNFPGLPDYIRELKAKGIKFVTILVHNSVFDST